MVQSRADIKITLRNYMKYRINYGDSVGVFPKSALNVIKRAGEGDVKVLLCLCALDGNADEKKLAKLSGLENDSIRDGLAFWRGAGVIEASAATDEAAAEKEPEDLKSGDRTDAKEEKMPKKKLSRSDELPNYTSEQLSEMIETRSDITTIINECQNIMGKVFNVHEINVLVGLVDYLSLDCEYIMMLLTHCVSMGKKTLHYAEKLAFALYDAGICTLDSLTEELRRRELMAQDEGKIRAMFGIGARAFTSKEKKFMSAWTAEMGYGMDIIQKAYEITADATGNASFAYANSVLERWNAAGLRTLEAIEESYKKDDGVKKQNNEQRPIMSDEYFEEAMRRALGED